MPLLEFITRTCQLCPWAEKTNKIASAIDCCSRRKLEFPCKYCYSLVAWPANLDSHVASVHEGPRRKCTQCNFTLTARTQLQRHSWACHGGKLKSVNIVAWAGIYFYNFDHGKPNTKITFSANTVLVYPSKDNIVTYIVGSFFSLPWCSDFLRTFRLSWCFAM